MTDKHYVTYPFMHAYIHEMFFMGMD